jgi:hypothetical protein
MLCRAANSRYETERAAARKSGDWNGIVDSAEARAYLAWLSRHGIDRHSVSAVTDISDSILWEVITGARSRIRARTARKILAVEPDLARGGKTIVPANRTWKRLRELIGLGYKKAWIARWLGRKSPALQLNRKRITWRNAVAVEKLCLAIESGRIERPQ